MNLKNVFKTVFGFLLFWFYPRKKIVFILSTMRSGSTLLKALLAEAPEAQHFNEVRFYRGENRYNAYYHYWRMSKKSILIVKSPANISDYLNYPELPNLSSNKILLIRNPTNTIASILKMNDILGVQQEVEEIVNYWCETYDKLALMKHKCKVVHYEEILRTPIELTNELFRTIGSKRNTGTNTYSLPASGKWDWGIDDGGELIKQLKVVDECKNDELDYVEIELTKYKKRLNATYVNYMHS